MVDEGGTVIKLEFVTNADQAGQAIKNFKRDVDSLASQKSSPAIDVNDQAARAKLADLRNEFARLQAQRVGITITADTNQADRSVKQIERETQILTAQTRLIKISADTSQAEKSVDSLTTKLGTIAAYSAGYQFFHLFEQAVGAAGQAVVGFNAQLEQMQIAFTQALGSASAADDFINQLKQFAIATPFQFGDLTKYAQQLMGMGIAAQDVIPDLRSLGDAVAGIGGSPELMQRIVTAFGQISAAGKANAQDLRQFSEAGIQAYQFLAKAIGTDVPGAIRQVTAGTVDSATAISALLAGINDKFGGLAEQQAKTFSGRLSNLKDAFNVELADLGKPLFEQLSSALDKVATYLQSGNFKSSFAAIAADIGDVFAVVEKLFAIFANVPPGLIEFGVRFAEIAVAVKALGSASSAMQTFLTASATSLRSMAAASAESTVATEAQTVANVENTASLEADTAALAANAAANTARSRVQLEGALGSKLQSGGTALAGGAAAGLAGLSEAAGPVGVAIAAVFIGTSLASQITDHIKEEEAKAFAAAQALSLKIEVSAALETSGLDGVTSAYDRLGAQINEATHEQDALTASMNATFDGFKHGAGAFGIEPALIAALEKTKDQLKAAQAQVDPEELQKQATAGLQARADQATKAISDLHGVTSTAQIDKNTSDAKAALAAMAGEYDKAHGSAANFNDELQAINQSLDDQATISKRTLVSQQEQMDEMTAHAKEIAKEAAATNLSMPTDVMAGLAGTSKESVDQIKLIESTYKDLAKTQDELNKAAAQSDADRAKVQADYVAALKQMDQASAQQAADQKARVDAMVQQWATVTQAVGQVISATQSAMSGINLDQGLSSLVAQADALAKARDALGGFGQNIGGLNDLTGIANSFKSIADAEDKASEAYKGYLLTIDETDKRIQLLDAYKKKLDDAVKSAQEAQKSGTINPAQQQLLDQSSTAYANIANYRQQLQTAEIPDLLGAGQNLPDLITADKTMRDMVDMAGGGKQVRLEVEADIKTVGQQLDALVNQERTIEIQLKLGDLDLSKLPSWAQNALGFTATGSGPGGYVNPTSQAQSGGGPYGTGSLTPPGGAGGTTPRGNPSNLLPYADLIHQAAQSYGVPDWVLGAIILHESGGVPGKVEEGGGLGRGLTQVDLGQHPGENVGLLTGTSQQAIAYQINEGARILRDSIANAGGNLAQGVQGYAGSAYKSQASGDVPAGLSLYNELSQFYQGPVQATLGGGQATGQIASGVGQQIVQKALQSVDTNTLAGYCEQFVEETVQAITGRRGAVGSNQSTAASALATAQQQGLGVSKAQAQPGDLVYYGASPGSPQGHVAIYMGGGQQVSTADAGGSAVHVEGIGAGAQFVHVPGVGQSPAYNAIRGAVGASGAAAGGATSAAGAFGTLNAFDPTTPAAIAANKKIADEQGALSFAIGHAADAQQRLTAAMRGMDAGQAAQLLTTFTSLNSIITKMAEAKLGPNADDVEKATAIKEAYAETVDVVALWAQAQHDIETSSANTAADIQKVADTVGGPLGQNLAAQLTAMQSIKTETAAIAKLTQDRTDLESAQQATTTSRQTADRAKAASDMMRGFANADADYARQQARTIENTSYAAIQRVEEDKTRLLQFNQQIQGTDLQNQLVDLQKQQQSTVWQRTAGEQLLGAQVQAAPTNAQAAASSPRNLAAMHDRDLMQKDEDARAVDALQTKIRLSQRQDAIDSFNLQSEIISTTRAHEDKMAGYAAEDAAIARARQLADRSAQISQFNTESLRLAEDQRYQAAIKGNEEQVAAQQQLLDADKQRLSDLQQTAAAYDSVDASLAGILNSVSSAVQSLGQVSSLANYPTTGAIRRLATGGTVPFGGQALVGEEGMEHLLVTPQGAVVTPLSTRPASEGGAVVVNIGTINGGMSEGQIDAVTQQFNTALKRAVKNAANAGSNQRRAVGA